MLEKLTQYCATLIVEDDTPPVMRFIALRMMATAGAHNLDSIRAEIRLIRRFLKKIDIDSPFNSSRIFAANAELARFEGLRDQCKDVECKIGRLIIDTGRELDDVLAFDEMCDLLEVNPAERAEIERSDFTEKRDFMTVASAFGFDHSATHRGKYTKGGAVYWAINEEIMRVMFDTPEGKEASDKMFKELFKPGGMFRGMPTYYRQPDGTMDRKSADLTVHDSNCSRVVERPIGR
jgi:hypothetical protein